jgi:glycosyltransferase involved in cell wall biosynthesis
MANNFHQYFKCADAIRALRADEPTTKKPGFFRFGRDLICYGPVASISPVKSPFANLPDVESLLRYEDGQVVLPFVPEQIAEGLLNETYSNQMEPEYTRLGSHSAVRRIYYWGRPLLSLRLRSVLQRIKLRGKLKSPFPSWPVDRSVDKLFEKLMIATIRANGGGPVPFIWFWPEGKQAAFVLTHDVEDDAGKTFCSSLMDIDDEYGFKASFQIVPEERYSVEPEFLQQFRDRQFDICVHDLNHDGYLYREYSEFKRRAKLINYYCKVFGANGFRSGVLYRNLRWYGEFDFAYDMSVPNVGHLDPQGGGCCTVMPYYVGDILEIPVTLTQDYSLFHILHQYSIDLWKQQIRTITDGHGLISVIIHPDYVIEPEQQQLFRSLLDFVRQQCSARQIWATVPSAINSWWRQRSAMNLVQGPEGWQVRGEGSDRARVAYACLSGDSLVYSFTPVEAAHADLAIAARDEVTRETPAISGGRFNESEVTEIVSPSAPSPVETTVSAAGVALERATQPRPAHRRLRVAMVSYSFYETDNRVLRYASTLAKRGDHVDVFALRREGKPAEELMEGVHVHRLQGRILNEKSQISYAWRICQFLVRAAIQVARFDLKERYDILHIHSVPDFMVLTGLLPKLRGTPVVLDIHDILPEFYASKFDSGKRSRLFQVLVGVERISCRFASHVIIANDIWRDRLLSRSLSPDKCSVVLNSPDRSIFTRSENGQPKNGKFLMLYPGSLNWHQGLDIAIRAFAKISKLAPQAEFHIYGDGPSKPDLLNLARELGVEHQVKMPSARSLREIAQIMETANLGIVPKRKDNFGNEAFSTKILEFMAMGVPVVVADTMIDKFYFDDSTVKFFRSGETDDLARCMIEMIENPVERQRQVQNANRFVETVDWNAKQHEYLELIDRLSVSVRT